MSEPNRRRLLTRAAFAGAGLVSAEVLAGARPAAAARATGGGCPPAFRSVTVKPGDPRYESFLRGHNTRFTGRPDRVTVASSADHVAEALARAVGAGRRVAVRSGGHCMENFTASPEVRELIDLSQMSDVYFDESRRAFTVEPGALVAATQETIFKGWGVMIPSAGCAEVGLGGHILGGGYNFYSRMNGLAVDHLHAVEVVVVDADGAPRTVVATRDASDPDRDLWWAHTGGGGGNFGVVTRYWFRTPGVDSADPSRLLPRAGNQRVRMMQWPWESMSQQAFTTLVRNYCRWFERNSAPGAKETQVWASFSATHRSAGTISLMAGVRESVEGGEALLDGLFADVTAGVGVKTASDTEYDLPWLDRENWYRDASGRQKNKTADLRKSYTEEQIATIYRHLSDDSFNNPSAQVNIAAMGGRINAVRSHATAAVHRTSILRVYFTAGVWRTPEEDARHMSWVRKLYRDVYRRTGGVPVPDEINAGAYINYPDTDLDDPEWNSSRVPWHAMYYGHNYARLQRVKKRYDPRSVFRHALSIRPA